MRTLALASDVVAGKFGAMDPALSIIEVACPPLCRAHYSQACKQIETAQARHEDECVMRAVVQARQNEEEARPGQAGILCACMPLQHKLLHQQRTMLVALWERRKLARDKNETCLHTIKS